MLSTLRYGYNRKTKTTLEEQNFNLLHLSIIRKYLEFDFMELKEHIKFEFDIDRIIDDWILMGFLAGNDFVPHLPGLHIKQEGLPYLHKKYMGVLPKLDGYISDAGKIHLPRFQKFVSTLAEFDLQEFQEHYVSMSYIRRKRSEKNARKMEEAKESLKKEEPQEDLDSDEHSPLEPFVDFMGMESDFVMSPTHNPDDINKELSSLGISQIPEELLEAPEDTDDSFFDIVTLNEKSLVPMELSEEAFTDINFSVDFKKYKRKYYENKFKKETSEVQSGFIHGLGFEYIRGLQWVLLYYYQGVRSWSWFYPFHYAPFVSDLSEVDNMPMEFDLSQPFEPYQQLMSVLPTLSKEIVPIPFQYLMEDNNSPIIDFYPSTFETDLNGKTHEWEAVVLLSFIEVDRLKTVMKGLYEKLTEEEVNRNRPGRMFSYTYKTVKQKSIQAPFEYLPEISPCFSEEEELAANPFPYEVDSLPTGLLNGANLDDYIPGYPTFNFVPHVMKKAVRQTYVNNAMVDKQRIQLNIREPEEPPTLKGLANKFVGKECLVNWPFFVRAFIEAVSDRNQVYELDPESSDNQMKIINMDERERDKWEKNVFNIDHVYSSKSGIGIGEADFMVHANVIVGKRVQFCKKKDDHPIRVEPEWDTTGNVYLLQSVRTFDEVRIFDPSPSLAELTLSDIFFKGRKCYIMRKDLYGSPAIVEKVDEVSRQVQLKMYNINNQAYVKDMHAINDKYLRTIPRYRRYLPGYIIAHKADIDKIVLSRITSGLFIFTGDSKKKKYHSTKLMISLNVKNSKKNLCQPEYAIREDKGWLYNPRMIDFLREYKQRFPDVFAILEMNPTCDDYYSCDMFEDDTATERLAELKEWLQTLPCYEQPLVTCGSELLNSECIKMVEKITDDLDIATKLKSNRKVVKCKPKDLFCPMFEFSEFAPDREAVYYILDRVLSISTEVPFGYVGTIIGYYPLNSTECMCEVLFDLEFPGAISIRGSAKRGYLLKSKLLIDLTHGQLSKENTEQVYQEGVFGCDDLENMESQNREERENRLTQKEMKFKSNRGRLQEDSAPDEPAVLPTVPFISHIHKPRGPRAFGNRYDESQLDPYGTSPNTQELLDTLEVDNSDNIDNSTFMELDNSDGLQGKSVNIYPSSSFNESIVGDLTWLEDSQPQTQPPRDFRKSKQQRQGRDLTPYFQSNHPMNLHNNGNPEMVFDPRSNIRMPMMRPYPPQGMYPPFMGTTPPFPVSPQFNNFSNNEAIRMGPHFNQPFMRPPHLPLSPQQFTAHRPGPYGYPGLLPYPPQYNPHQLPPEVDPNVNNTHPNPLREQPPNFPPGLLSGMPFQSPPRQMNPRMPFPPHPMGAPHIRLPPNVSSYRDVLEHHCLSLGLGFPDYQHMVNHESSEGFIGMVKINVDGTLQTFMGAPSNTVDESYESAACKTLYEFQSGPLVERGITSPSPPTLPPHPLFTNPRNHVSCPLIPTAVMKNLAHKRAVKNRIVEKEGGHTLLTAQQVNLIGGKPKTVETSGESV